MGSSSSARTTWGAMIAIVFAVVCGEIQPCKNATTQGFSFCTQRLVVTHFLLAVILAAGFGVFSPSLIGTLFVVLTFVVILGAFGHQPIMVEDAETADLARGGLRSAKLLSAQPCVMVCDPGRTTDSELALAMLRVLRDLGQIDPKAIIANTWPQEDRSHLLRKRLDSFGLHDVPVGVGTSGGALKTDTAVAEKLRALDEDPAFAGKLDRASEIVPGGQLLQTTWDSAAPASLVLLLTSSLKVRDCHKRSPLPPGRVALTNLCHVLRHFAGRTRQFSFAIPRVVSWRRSNPLYCWVELVALVEMTLPVQSRAMTHSTAGDLQSGKCWPSQDLSLLNLHSRQTTRK